MKLSSDSFQNGGEMEARYVMKAVRGGLNISPHLAITDVPAAAKTLALSCVDRHPKAGSWVHWLAVNIPAKPVIINEGASPTSMPSGTIELINTFGAKGYGGPQPPRGSGRHEYEFTVYALSDRFPAGEKQMSGKEFLETTHGKILSKDSITGFFENK